MKNYNWIKHIINSKDKKIKEAFKTPRVIENENDYLNDLYQWLENLEDLLKKDINVELKYVTTVHEYHMKIKKIFDAYLRGNWGEAYNDVVGIIREFNNTDNNLAISSIKNSIAFNNVERVLDKNCINSRIEFYRARKSDKYTVFKREEMLHISFDERRNISSNRFSVLGLPCFYLGTSSHCCWLEARTPADHQFNVSPVLINEEQKILNLTINSTLFEQIIELAKTNNKYNVNSIEALKLWILTYATSYNVNQENRAFKIEYVLSQLIMLASMEFGLSGISYLSKRVEDDRFAHILDVNLALFAKFNDEKKLSEICKEIEIAPSYNYSMYKQLNYVNCNKQKTRMEENKDNEILKIGNFSRQSNYADTEFYKFDRFLFTKLKNEISKIDVDLVNK